MRESHSFAKFVLCALGASAGAVTLVTEYRTAGAVLIFFFGLGALWQVADSLWGRRNDEIYERRALVGERRKFGSEATQWDRETRLFLAHEWPEMGVEFGDDQIEYVLYKGVNTGILTAFLREFLRDSSEYTFADVRNYNDDKRLQEQFNCSRETVRIQHKLAREFLEKRRILIENSMAGNSPFKWATKDHYHWMMRRYLARDPLPEMK